MDPGSESATYGARACILFGQDRGKLCLEREEIQIVDHGNMKERAVLLENHKYF